MDIIIRRLRNEPALIWGLLGTVAALIVTLVNGGGLTVTAIPLIVAAIAKQFTTGPVTAENLKEDNYLEGFQDGINDERDTRTMLDAFANTNSDPVVAAFWPASRSPRAARPPRTSGTTASTTPSRPASAVRTPPARASRFAHTLLTVV